MYAFKDNPRAKPGFQIPRRRMATYNPDDRRWARIIRWCDLRGAARVHSAIGHPWNVPNIHLQLLECDRVRASMAPAARQQWRPTLFADRRCLRRDPRPSGSDRLELTYKRAYAARDRRRL
jgi:hypothetical protein